MQFRPWRPTIRGLGATSRGNYRTRYIHQYTLSLANSSARPAAALRDQSRLQLALVEQVDSAKSGKISYRQERPDEPKVGVAERFC